MNCSHARAEACYYEAVDRSGVTSRSVHLWYRCLDCGGEVENFAPLADSARLVGEGPRLLSRAANAKGEL